jgi:hypothetical protein
VQPYRRIPFSAVNSKSHQDLALQAARESMTLLKNEPKSSASATTSASASAASAPVLPLSASTVKSVAVIGPNANCTQKGSGNSCNQLGNYATFAPFVITPVDGMAMLCNATGSQGCAINTKYAKPTYSTCIVCRGTSAVGGWVCNSTKTYSDHSPSQSFSTGTVSRRQLWTRRALLWLCPKLVLPMQSSW